MGRTKKKKEKEKEEGREIRVAVVGRKNARESRRERDKRISIFGRFVACFEHDRLDGAISWLAGHCVRSKIPFGPWEKNEMRGWLR